MVITLYNNTNNNNVFIIISEYIIIKNPTSVWNGLEWIMGIWFSSFDMSNPFHLIYILILVGINIWNSMHCNGLYEFKLKGLFI